MKFNYLSIIVAMLLYPWISFANAKQSTDDDQKTINNNLRIGMIHCCVESDSFMWGIANNIRNAAAQDGTTILFKNAEGSQDKSLRALDELKKQNINAILMSIVIDDTLKKPYQQKLLDALKQTNLPVVFYLLGVEERFMGDYKKAYRVGSTPAQSGILQGEMVSEQWLAHPEWDRNGDGIMQYALLKGPAGNPDAEGRTKWIRATLETFPVGEMQSQEVAFDVANWDRKKAQQIVSEWIRNGKARNIEVFISNNDDMMLGARDAFQNSNLKPAFFGIDALPETIKLIKEGEVAGTVLQDTKAQSKNAYRLAVNLAKGRPDNNNLEFPVVRQELVVPYIPVTQSNVNDISE